MPRAVTPPIWSKPPIASQSPRNGTIAFTVPLTPRPAPIWRHAVPSCAITLHDATPVAPLGGAPPRRNSPPTPPNDAHVLPSKRHTYAPGAVNAPPANSSVPRASSVVPNVGPVPDRPTGCHDVPFHAAGPFSSVVPENVKEPAATSWPP